MSMYISEAVHGYEHLIQQAQDDYIIACEQGMDELAKEALERIGFLHRLKAEQVLQELESKDINRSRYIGD